MVKSCPHLIVTRAGRVTRLRSTKRFLSKYLSYFYVGRLFDPFDSLLRPPTNRRRDHGRPNGSLEPVLETAQTNERTERTNERTNRTEPTNARTDSLPACLPACLRLFM